MTADASDYTWTAAVIGSDNAAPYQLSTGTAVLAVGGFNGTDPSPTLLQFQTDVLQKKIHYFIDATMFAPRRGGSSGSHDAVEIADWVAGHYPAQRVDGVTVYDLAARS